MTGGPDPVAPPLDRLTIMSQWWRDLTFLHWRVDPGEVAHLMPAGTRPDVIDGSSWVGLVPFRMVAAGPGHGPAVPWLGTFCETNVRLYSVGEDGRRGVVFLSLEAERLAVVLGARAVFGIPYMWARMSMQRRRDASGSSVEYSTSRRWPGPRGAGGRIEVRIGDRIEHPDPLQVWLTARWAAHSRHLGRLLYVPNEHEPWPLRHADVVALDDTLLAAAGLADLATRSPDSVMFSEGVFARFARPNVSA